MPKFFTEEQRGQIGGGFFEWEDGVPVKMKLTFRTEDHKGKPTPVLDFINVDTKEEGTLKFQFKLLKALDEMPEYKEGDVIEITPIRLPKDREVNGKTYKDFDFTVKNIGESNPF